MPTFSIGLLKTKDLAFFIQPYCERQASSRDHALPNDSPPVRDAAFWAKLDKELEFLYEAEYPAKELPDE